MRYKTKYYSVYSSLYFETLQELRYKEVVRTFFTKTLNDGEPPLDKFEIYDALINLSSFMEERGFLVFKIEGPYTICVYRWDQGKPIITVTINIRNVDNISK